MPTPLACVVCSLDPQTTSLVLPLAQATIIAAPMILRKQIARRVGTMRAHHSRRRAASRLSAGPEPSTARPGRKGERER